MTKINIATSKPNSLLELHNHRSGLQFSELYNNLFNSYMVKAPTNFICGNPPIQAFNPVHASVEILKQFMFNQTFEELIIGSTRMINNMTKFVPKAYWSVLFRNMSHNLLLYGDIFVKTTKNEINVLDNRDIKRYEVDHITNDIIGLHIFKKNQFYTYSEEWSLTNKKVIITTDNKATVFTFKQMGIDSIPVKYYKLSEFHESYPYYWDRLKKIDYLNYLYNIIMDRLLRFDKPLLVLSNTTGTSQKKARRFKDTNLLGKINKEAIISLPADTKLDTIQLSSDLSTAISMYNSLSDQLKDEMPELALQRLVKSNNLSGETVKYILIDCIAFIKNLRRVIYSIGVQVVDHYLGIDSQVKFTLTPIIENTLYDDAKLIKLLRESGVPFPIILKWINKTPEEISEFMRFVDVVPELTNNENSIPDQTDL